LALVKIKSGDSCSSITIARLRNRMRMALTYADAPEAGRAGVTTFIFTCVNCVTRKARPQVS